MLIETDAVFMTVLLPLNQYDNAVGPRYIAASKLLPKIPEEVLAAGKAINLNFAFIVKLVA